MIAYLSAGVVLGLSAGLAPGPLLALVLSQTIRHGPKEGAKVAFAPLITDFPIMFVSTWLLASFSNYNAVLAVVSIVGGIFLVYLAYESLRTDGVKVKMDGVAPKSILRGTIANALNPHPYLFWMTVGASTILKGWAESVLLPVMFIGSFYVCLIGSKVLLAVLAGKSRQFLSGRAYIFINRALGLAIFAFAIILFKDALSLLN